MRIKDILLHIRVYLNVHYRRGKSKVFTLRYLVQMQTVAIIEFYIYGTAVSRHETTSHIWALYGSSLKFLWSSIKHHCKVSYI